MAQDGAPGSELQTERVDDSGDLTAEAASSGVRQPGILGLLDLRVGDLILILRRSASVLKEADTEKGSVIQHVSALARPELADQRMMLCNFRISAVTTKCDTQFEHDLEIAGMKREMHSMLDFDVL